MYSLFPSNCLLFIAILSGFQSHTVESTQKADILILTVTWPSQVFPEPTTTPFLYHPTYLTVVPNATDQVQHHLYLLLPLNADRWVPETTTLLFSGHHHEVCLRNRFSLDLPLRSPRRGSEVLRGVPRCPPRRQPLPDGILPSRRCPWQRDPGLHAAGSQQLLQQ